MIMRLVMVAALAGALSWAAPVRGEVLDPLSSVAVVSEGRKLVVFRKLDQGGRRVLARKRLPGVPTQLIRRGRHVYAACGYSGFVVVDISEPVRPRIVASATGIGTVRKLEVRASLLVVSVGKYEFRAYDVTDPARFVPLTLEEMGKRLEAFVAERPPRLRSLPTDPAPLGKGHLKGLPAHRKLPSSLLRDLPAPGGRPPAAVPRRPPRLMDVPGREEPPRPGQRKGSLRSRVMDVQFSDRPAGAPNKRPVRSRVLDVDFDRPEARKRRKRSTGP